LRRLDRDLQDLVSNRLRTKTRSLANPDDLRYGTLVEDEMRKIDHVIDGVLGNNDDLEDVIKISKDILEISATQYFKESVQLQAQSRAIAKAVADRSGALSLPDIHKEDTYTKAPMSNREYSCNIRRFAPKNFQFQLEKLDQHPHQAPSESGSSTHPSEVLLLPLVKPIIPSALHEDKQLLQALDSLGPPRQLSQLQCEHLSPSVSMSLASEESAVSTLGRLPTLSELESRPGPESCRTRLVPRPYKESLDCAPQHAGKYTPAHRTAMQFFNSRVKTKPKPSAPPTKRGIGAQPSTLMLLPPGPVDYNNLLNEQKKQQEVVQESNRVYNSMLQRHFEIQEASLHRLSHLQETTEKFRNMMAHLKGKTGASHTAREETV